MKKIIKKVLICLLCTLLVVIIIAGGYVGYILISYHRIGDVQLEVTKNSNLESVNINEEYSITTYNIGFGAYSQDYTFFLDTGYDIDGNETVGKSGKANSKDEVLFNTTGSINTMKSLNSDFILLQEVDIKSTRSYKVNQNQMFLDSFNTYDNAFACNFDSAFLPYPLHDMHGKSLAGLSTFSKYKIQNAFRKEYTISDSLSKLFDLDRCFSVQTIKVSNGKNLYIVNSHMSAYDKGGVIREKQIKELNDFLDSKKDEYVIVGGDFNHDLLTNNPEFEYTSINRPFNNVLKDPDWVASYFTDEKKSPLSNGYKVVASDNVPTCRNNDIKWDPTLTYKCVVDGFIVSNNIEIINHYNVLTKNGNLNIDGFAYSDHQPAYMSFKLK